MVGAEIRCRKRILSSGGVQVSAVGATSVTGADEDAAQGKAVAVVYFRGDQSSSADRCQQLIDMFKLTQSEARFAWSIAQGLSIAEAAEKHGYETMLLEKTLKKSSHLPLRRFLIGSTYLSFKDKALLVKP